MKLYHFLKDQYAKEDIINKRIKGSTIQDVNDPLEFLNLKLSNFKDQANSIYAKECLNNEACFISFSKKWNNPVLWGHYADKHAGTCLGFEVETNECKEIHYSSSKIVVDKANLIKSNDYLDQISTLALTTKYLDWKYEDEVRIFIAKENEEIGYYYYYFDQKIQLTEIIIGCMNKSKKTDYVKLVKGWKNDVDVKKAKISFINYELDKT
jgi:hypothetical protein